ncbi:MAG: LacI family DNA-binding transcriptional regulator [Eubacteriales bacterium]|jgi:LacI family transcriptional regulator|nr:LacI family DNA-binding transcriptional regulator [Eubacteriales bacterium]MDD4105208.1 LacI family DNA-binding transcriptional regulator [Eubacteriales bacterium]MDD4710430.1 LacI family DNA-binding transcriptional regulator [Eubacteriales bacterium]NLO15630.1 LacI family transcriptional regulator [Clostridiales bacterium]
MVSMKEVARLANVSVSTVSRVLSGSVGVSEKRKARVTDAVRRLDYHPNELAKSLKMGHTHTIALMVPSIQNLIFPAIVRGVEDAARKAGYTVILCNTDEDIEEEKRYIARLRTRFIDGFIVASMLPDSDHIRQLHKDGFPVVLTSRLYDETMDAVGIDNEGAAYEATGYLVKTGCKRIVFAMGRPEIPLYKDRFEGYKRALKETDLPYDERLVLHERNGTGSFYRLLMDLIRSGVQFDGVFSSSDPKAYVLLRALHDAGLSIPQDVSVISIDNVDTSSQIEPPLSVISQPLYEIGELAARKLIRQIDYKSRTGTLPPPQVDMLKTKLIVRKSTR